MTLRASNERIMTADDLLSELHKIETALRSPEVQLFIRAQDERTRKRFVLQLNRVSKLFNQLENEQLKVVAEKLQEFDGELKSGIEGVKEKIEDLDNAIAVIRSVSQFLGIAARVVTLLV